MYQNVFISVFFYIAKSAESSLLGKIFRAKSGKWPR